MGNSPFWNEDWMQTQQKYWQQWSDMGLTQQQSPWENAMDHWWQAVSPNASHNNQAFMEKMLAQGKLFFRLGDGLAQNLQQDQDWGEALNKTFEQIQNSFQQAGNSAENGIQQWMNLWQGPLAQWQKFTDSLPGKLDGLDAGNPMSQFLGMPGLGYAREDEESFKQLLQAGMDYQKTCMQYNQFFSDLGNASVQRMQDKVRVLAKQGESIDSGRAAYDLWVSASEEIYAERTMTAEYAELHGKLVNALMRVKKQWGEILDQRLGAIGMPTRREIRTLQTRLQGSRREVQQMQSALKATQQQLEALQVQVAKPASEAAPTVTKKAVVKKAAAKKAPAKKATVKKTAKKKATRKKATGK